MILVVVQLVFIVHYKNPQVILNQLQLMVTSKHKQHITMKPRSAHNIQHVVLNEDIHWMKIVKKYTVLLLIKYNLIHTLLMVFQVQIQSVKRKL